MNVRALMGRKLRVADRWNMSAGGGMVAVRPGAAPARQGRLGLSLGDDAMPLNISGSAVAGRQISLPVSGDCIMTGHVATGGGFTIN